MTLLPLVFLLACAACTLAFRKEWAPIPLLATCCYMTTGHGVEVAGVSLPAFRVILAVGLLRVTLRRESLVGGVNKIDVLVAMLAFWVVFAGFFHERQSGSGPIYASGFVFNFSLIYFLARIWCAGEVALLRLARVIAWLLVPVALAMIAEQVTYKNYFGVLLGGVSEWAYVRDGQIRAQGPFGHPILAGVVGAVNVPLMIAALKTYRYSAVAGLLVCFCMVLTSRSSAPLVSLVVSISGVVMWKYRGWMRAFRWGAFFLYLLAALLMTSPVYYLMARIDLTGSSTGWHRARLIEMAIAHFREWWAVGTDYTGHWMVNQLDEAGRHVDITNYYLWFGVTGGFIALALVVVILCTAFSWVGRCIRAYPADSQHDAFPVWCLGAGLFSFAITGLSVSFVDQSMTFFWLSVGMISSMHGPLGKGNESLELASPRRSSTSGVRAWRRGARVRRNSGLIG